MRIAVWVTACHRLPLPSPDRPFHSSIAGPGCRLRQLPATIMVCIGPGLCSRIRILRFFRIKKQDFLRFFKMTYQIVAKSLWQKFSHQSVKMSSYTSLSDQYNWASWNNSGLSAVLVYLGILYHSMQNFVSYLNITLDYLLATCNTT